jgi:predicted DsbA family dithiol-disulfide isomerase
MKQQLHIDVYVDLVCPWCLIGKRHLDQALAQWREVEPSVPVDVQWHSVQLVPDVPEQGVDFSEFYLRRLGGPQAVQMRQAQVREAAAGVGAEVDLARIARFPNTRKAHQVMAFAVRHLDTAQFTLLLERLFAAYFSRGEDIGALDTLQVVSEKFGLPWPAVQEWISAGHGQPQQQDVAGVPYFVFNRTQSTSGAQPAAALLAAMRQAVTEVA